MNLNTYLDDNSNIYTLRGGTLQLFSNVSSLLPTDIVLNDNTIDINSSYDRNISVLYNKLIKKMDKSTTFDVSMIECNAPHGSILMSEGIGQTPVWVSIDEFKSSLSEYEIVFNEGLLYNNTTITMDSIYSATGFKVTDRFTVISSTNELIFKPISVPLIVDYYISVIVTPKVKTVMGYTTNIIIVDGVDFDDTYMLYISSDNGFTKIDIKDVVIGSTSSTITTDSYFSGAYKAYLFKLDFFTSVYTTDKVEVIHNIEEIYPNGNLLNIKYTRKECNGTMFDMRAIGNLGLEINSIFVNFNTNKDE